MGESPTAAPERDVLLATKLYMPAARPELVPRPRLTARLDEGLARGLVLVCAPAGYGKTVLLADWARRGGQPVAWLSLDAGDNDPARFWRHAVAALDRARPGTGERVAPLLGPPAPSSFQGLVMALINDLAADEALLVLDDYHVIGSRQVHESLAFLVERGQAGICVVLASRSDPPLPLARLRARGQLTEMRVAELRFTPAEAAELLRHAASALPDASVAALAARTEGWAAGLQLAVLSLRGHDDAAAFVAAFTGSHRYVLDYLAEEVLEGQGKQLRTFLLETSVLERLSGPLCDAVTGREGSQALLEEAERAGLFLIPLDEVRGWWRYHHLFAGLLRARLQDEQPSRRRSCTATPRRGTRSTGWPMTPSATRPPPGRCSGRPGSSSSTSIWSTAPAARPRLSTGGCRSSPLRWSGPAPGCCWRRPSWPPPAAASRSWNRSWTRLSARPPAGPMSRSSQPPAWRPAT